MPRTNIYQKLGAALCKSFEGESFTCNIHIPKQEEKLSDVPSLI